MQSRRISKKILTVFLFVGLSAGVGWAGEDLFMVDSFGNSGTHLYRVTLDSGSGMGVLTPLMLNMPLGGTYALACTQDGERCYLIERDTGYFGYYDLVANAWFPVGHVDFGGPFTGIAGAVCAPDGSILAASQDTDLIYAIDPETRKVTVVGDVFCDGQPVDLSGADMAFNSNGEFFIWTNSVWTLYTAELPSTYPGTLVATQVMCADFGTFTTGMAFRGNGYGCPVGSVRAPSKFLVGNPDGTVTEFPMLNFSHRYGDMANGWMATCTRTIGYYKNHDWEGATVHVCGVEVDEEVGAEVMWEARGKNFSMLFAQLIAAKLNVADATGVDVIDDAEDWLCQQANAFDGTDLFWDAGFTDRTQKGAANGYKTPLDDFNNSNHCDCN